MRVYIGIGSNLSNRHGNCLRAIELLQEGGMLVTARSGMHKTAAWGETAQPDFINMCVEIETDLPPGKLLHVLKAIETQMGRTPTRRWGPRVIDLDILLYGGLVVREEGLTIPHPYMHQRGFVLHPLREIASTVVHPVLNKSVGELAANVV
ncbi:2-amino-4-hydroxy-6-hydroxymethyldihydropteridine pyrophosphokinase [Candidatus Magnetobacterium bavaricum]|uniref:2-amino-4-hydroxy-6-hydroxymethyldihydropteridine pyrophosphokinase n=1 Tax=Candidatus Magnetobacterium bavaricum TaxID=29290 RepID=A0A0F3GWL3_9BACT|nr:2-amino-4-hydroxy-6-hydroxymethyldihydropteridine pyrophosphokinase [Candidatus Magnetobacterium bavaricum]